MPDPLYSYPDITTSGKKIYMNVTTFSELKKTVLGDRADADEIMEDIINGSEEMTTPGRYTNMWNLLRNGFEYSDVQLSSSSSGTAPTVAAKISNSYPVIDRQAASIPKITMPETRLDKSLTDRSDRVFLLIGCKMNLTIENFGSVSVYPGDTSKITPNTYSVQFLRDSRSNLSLNMDISGESLQSYLVDGHSPEFEYYTDGDPDGRVGVLDIRNSSKKLSNLQPVFKSILYGQYTNAYGATISYGYSDARSDSSIGVSEKNAGVINKQPSCILIYEVGTLSAIMSSSVARAGKILINSLDVAKAAEGQGIQFRLYVQLAQRNSGVALNSFSVADEFMLTPTQGVIKSGTTYGAPVNISSNFSISSPKSINFGKLPFSHSIILQVVGVNPQPRYSTYYLGCKETPDADHYPDGMRKKSVHHYFWCTKNPSVSNTSNNPASLHIRFALGGSMFQGDTFYAPENCELKYMDSSGNLQLFNPMAAELKPRISETPPGYYDKYFTLPVVLEQIQDINPSVYDERSKFRPLFVTSMMGSMKTFKSLTSDHFDMERGNTVTDTPSLGPRGMAVGSWTINNFGRIKESVAPGTSSSSYWMFDRDKDDAGIYRETIEYGPLYFEPIIADDEEERREETYKYIFYFHFFYFDYGEYMNYLIDEGDELETTAVLSTADYPFFDNDRINYVDEGTEDIERTDLTLDQANLIWMKILVGENGKVIFPEDEDRKLYYGMMTPDDNEYLPEIERDRVQLFDIAHKNMKPLSVKYPDIREALNKNKAFPFEILWEPGRDDIQDWYTSFNNKMNSTNRAVYPTFTDRLDDENVTGMIGTYVDDQLSSTSTRISSISYVAKLDNN